MAEQPKLAQDRLAFLISLVTFLPDGEPVPVSEVATHFGVEPEHVRTSIELIAVSGIPGETATYLPGDLFDIDWDALELHDEIVLTNRVAIDDAPRLSAREAAALIAGLQSISHVPGIDQSTFDGLVRKLAMGTAGVPSAVTVSRLDASPVTAAISTAITAGRSIAFDYRSAHGTSQHRIVDPLRIESIDTDIYLRAWCHRRDAVRTFRLDRIVGLETLAQPVSHTAGDLDLPSAIFSGTDLDLEVTIEFDDIGLPLVSDYAPRRLDPSSRAGRSVAVIALSHPDVVWRLIAELPSAVVIGPASARAAVASRAADAIARYARAHPGGSEGSE